MPRDALAGAGAAEPDEAGAPGAAGASLATADVEPAGAGADAVFEPPHDATTVTEAREIRRIRVLRTGASIPS
jgi:hypothetical protein